MTLGPTLETSRLILRPPQQADFDDWADFYGDDENLRFVGGGQGRDAAWRFMATMAGSWALLGYAMFSVVEKSSGRVIGRIGPWRPGGEDGGWPGPEVGWGLRRDAQGRGYAYEASEAAIEWAFESLGWSDVIHCIDKANTPSIKLAERLGSRWLRQATLPAPFNNTIEIYGQSRDEWRSRER